MDGQKLANAYDEVVLPTMVSLSIEILSKQERKTSKLLGNVDKNLFIASQGKWYEFPFKEVFYIKEVIVGADGFTQDHECEISYIEAFTGTEFKIKSKFNGDSFDFAVNRFAGGFGIKPDPRYFASPTLKYVNIVGSEVRSFENTIAIFNDVNGAKEKLINECDHKIKLADDASTSLGAIKEQTKEEEAKFEDILEQAELKKLENSKIDERLSVLRGEVTNWEQKVQNSRSVIEANETELNKLKSEQKGIILEITNTSAELRKLENEFNLFPSEIAGYLKQGASNIKLYAALLTIPFAIVIFMTWRLIGNSEKILDYFTNKTDIGIIEFLISRLPYVIVSFVIIGVCYTIIHRLLSEIIAINRRRQDLYKISIIATDVSFASQHKLDLTDEEIYAFRTAVKIDMLKEHLRRHLGEDYKYMGGRWPLNMLTDIATSSERNHIGHDQEEQEKELDQVKQAS